MLSSGQKIQDLGVGEIILSDINLDGTGEGLNLDVSKIVSNNLEIPVIISSGVAKQSILSMDLKIQMSKVSLQKFFQIKIKIFIKLDLN